MMSELESEMETEVVEASLRPWAVKAITWLLFGQTAVLFGTAVYTFLILDEIILPQADVGQIVALLTVLNIPIIFISQSLLVLAAAFSFLGLWRGGWSISMLAQGLILIATLALFSFTAPFYVYLNMGYAVALVLYLHHPDVEAAFHVKDPPNGESA
ncbi:MAG: hypothetical protein R6X32_06980 [Chloroflexota bacterium]